MQEQDQERRSALCAFLGGGERAPISQLLHVEGQGTYGKQTDGREKGGGFSERESIQVEPARFIAMDP